MTYKEISITIEAYNNKQRYELQKQASMHYKLADMIGVSVSRLMDRNSQLPSIFEAYPSVFDKEIEEEQKRKQAEQKQKLQIEKLKAMVLNHANDHNRNKKR